MDYFASKKTTLGFVASGFIDNENQLNYNTSYLKNASNEVDSIVNSTSDGNNKWKNGNLNLNFRHEFDSTGRELTAILTIQNILLRIIKCSRMPPLIPTEQNEGRQNCLVTSRRHQYIFCEDRLHPSFEEKHKD